MAGTGDAEVRFVSKFDNKGLLLGLRNSARDVQKMQKEFDSTTASIRKQETAVADLQRRLDAIVKGKKTPASLKAMQSALKDVERETRNVQTANKDMIAAYDAAAAKAEQFRPFGGEAFADAVAEVDRLAENLRPVWDGMDELDAKAKDLRASISGVKITPETSAEAQLLADKIANANINIEQSKEKASELQESIMRIAQTGLDKPADGIAAIGDNAERSDKAIKQAMDTRLFTRFGNTIKGVGKHVLGLASGMKMFKRDTNDSGNAVTRFAGRLKGLVAAALVFNVIRRGLSELKNYIGGLLQTNADFVNSLEQIKVNLMTAFQPIYEAILPPLNALMAALAKATAYIASFVSMLFGKTYAESKAAAKALNGQAAALKNTGKAADEASKSVQSFDQMNKLAAEDAGGSDIDSMILDFEANPPDFSWMDESLSVFKSAWDNVGEYVIDGWKHALREIIGLVKDVGKTFLEVWTDGHGQAFLESLLKVLGTIGYIIGDIAKAFRAAWETDGNAFVTSIFEMFTSILDLLNSIGVAFREAWNSGIGESIARNLLQIFTNVNDVIGGLADRLREAWEANGNGVAIWEVILGVINSVLETIDRITASTAEWVENLDLEPLMTGFRGLLEAIQPVVDILLDGLGWAWENIILPFGKWLLELGVPAGLDLLTAAFELLGTVLEALGKIFTWLWDVAAKPALESLGSTAKSIIESVIVILQGLNDFISGVFSGDWGKAWDGIKQIFSGALDTMLAVLGSFRDIMFGIFGKIGDAIGGLIGKITGAKSSASGLGEMSVGASSAVIPASFSLDSYDMPRLASGGIVDSTTIAMIGERGREAVLPLENNTEWMDTLASKIRDGGNDNSEVTSLLRELINLTKAGHVIEMDGQVTGRTNIRNQNSISRQFGVSPVTV